MTKRLAPFASKTPTICRVPGCGISLLSSSLVKHVRDKHPEVYQLDQQKKLRTQPTLVFGRPDVAGPSTSTQPVLLNPAERIT